MAIAVLEKGKPMDDLISRQAVLEATSTTLKITGKENAETVYAYIKKLCDDIKALPSAQRWIPCTERLPECDYTDVLICVHDKRKGCENDFYVIQAYTVGKHWEPTLHVDMTDLSVVAWMPLPSPYREEVSD